MNKAGALRFYAFGRSDPLSSLPDMRQSQYLQCYFRDLGAVVVIKEPSYFDRDYLAEFSAFYSISTKGYPNLCSRLHFFSDSKITRELLRRAAGGNGRSIQRLQDSYLGFTVIRPIPSAPLGRTVVRWYPEQPTQTPRVVEPSRDYFVHLAGITLSVNGLAWQQQDTGVGACATVGLWTMLHASAFDDHHAIPTTADITQAAHKRASLGARMFPSTGLTIYQMCEAIKEQNLSPLLVDGDIKDSQGQTIGFSRERFSSSCAAFVRSGYPVLLIGELDQGSHAVCVVGFRSCSPQPVSVGDVSLQESDIEHLYIHDDNLGPNIRFKINGITINTTAGAPIIQAQIVPDAPKPSPSCPTNSYPVFTPRQMVVAVHNDLRTSPDTLHRAGLVQAQNIVPILNFLISKYGGAQTGLTVSTRFVRLADYMGRELEKTLGTNKSLLSRVRLALCENVPPMSLHLGVVRIGLPDSTPLLDILYDTTDSDRNHPVFAHIAYSPIIEHIVSAIVSGKRGEYGVAVQAY